MNILYLNHNLIWRGTFFRCFGFARELVKKGHHVDLWTVSRDVLWFGRKEIRDGVHIWLTPRWAPLGQHDGGYAPIDNLFRLFKASRNRWDIIHAFDHRPNVLFPWLWLKLRNPIGWKKTLFISDWCDWWAGGGITTSRRPFKWIDRLEEQIEVGSKRWSDGVTVISTVLYNRALKSGISSDKLITIPSGVDVSLFPDLDRQKCRQQIGVPLDRPVVGFVGFSLWDMKMLAEIFNEIKKQCSNTVLLVIGGGVEEQSKDIFRQQFRLNEDVFLPGTVPFERVPVYLGACDVQLLPMEHNSANQARIPNKLFDYCASGRPLVVSNVGDTAGIVSKYEAGFVANQTDSFAQYVVQLLKNETLAQNFGNKARALAEGPFAYTNLTTTLLSFYKQLLNGKI